MYSKCGGESITRPRQSISGSEVSPAALEAWVQFQANSERERDLSWVMPNKDMNFYSNIWGSLIKSDGEEYADTYSNCTNKPGNA